jgi:hypothetical protein
MKVKLTNNVDFATIDEADGSTVLAHRWRNNGGYAITTIAGKTVYMHQLIMPSAGQIDHKNGYGLDNTRLNLRQSNQAQNMANRRKLKPKSSRFKGVSWNKKHGKWQAHIMRSKRSFNLGEFTDEIEAAKAYDVAAKEHFGEFARLNLEALWAI